MGEERQGAEQGKPVHAASDWLSRGPVQCFREGVLPCLRLLRCACAGGERVGTSCKGRQTPYTKVGWSGCGVGRWRCKTPGAPESLTSKVKRILVQWGFVLFCLALQVQGLKKLDKNSELLFSTEIFSKRRKSYMF